MKEGCMLEAQTPRVNGRLASMDASRVQATRMRYNIPLSRGTCKIIEK